MSSLFGKIMFRQFQQKLPEFFVQIVYFANSLCWRPSTKRQKERGEITPHSSFCLFCYKSLCPFYSWQQSHAFWNGSIALTLLCFSLCVFSYAYLFPFDTPWVINLFNRYSVAKNYHTSTMVTSLLLLPYSIFKIHRSGCLKLCDIFTIGAIINSISCRFTIGTIINSVFCHFYLLSLSLSWLYYITDGLLCQEFF